MRRSASRGVVHDLLRGAVGDQLAAVTSGAGAEVDHVVGAANGFLIVLDHQHGIAEVAQLFERLQQAIVVAMMQADGGLVEHVQHAAQLRADLRRQANALAFAAGQRRGRTVERDVAQADGVQELQALGDLVHDASGDVLFASAELDLLRRLRAARDTGSAVKSAIDMPFTFTARLSGRRRLPWHAGHSVADM